MIEISRSFIECFLRVDLGVTPRPISIRKLEYDFEIVVENAFIGPSTRKLLSEFFGGLSVKCEQILSTQNVRVCVSRFELPMNGYGLNKVIKYIDTHFDQGYFLGIGHFGPVHLPLSQFTHMAMFGTSGFGKSVMFKGLIAQTLAFEERTINYMVDYKKVDFVGLNRHPAFKGIATDVIQAKQLLMALNVELAYREHVFSTSFEVPPVNITEYWSSRAKFKREDIPDFPRIMVWIDEAHLMFDSFEHEENRMMTPLMRKGRAFGIHFVFSTQRPSDIPHSVLSQVPERLSFYLNSGSESSYYFDSLEKEFGEFRSIRGRFRYVNNLSGESFEAQAVFMNAEEALGMAFHYRQSSRYEGLSEILLPKEWMDDYELPKALIDGASLFSVLQMKADFKRNSYGGKGTQSADMGKFFPMISIAKAKHTENEKSEKEENLNTSNDTNSEIDPDKLVLLSDKALKFEKVDNSTDIVQLTGSFAKLLSVSILDFTWAFRDLSSNSGLLKMYADLRGTADQNNLKLKIDELALDDRAIEALQKWSLDVSRTISSSGNAPVLLISSYPGYGKKTILDTLSRHLGFPWRKFLQSDLLGDAAKAGAIPEDLKHVVSSEVEAQTEVDANSKKDKAKGKSQSDEKKKNDPTLICFDSIDAAVTFSRHRGSGQPAVCLIDLASLGRKSFKNPVDILVREVRSSSEPLVHLHIPTGYYSEKVLGDKLIRTLAASRGYIGDLKDLSVALFAKAGLSVVPSLLASIIDRASRTASLKNVSFNLDVLKEVLGEIQTKAFAEKSDAITFVKPEKSLTELMVDESCTKQIQEAIKRSLTLESQKFEFAKKLRRGQKLVCLFWGPPGTGKSLSGEVIAKESNRDLWVADIGKMQSAYVGETEKILSSVFESAKAADVVLQLDECDSFLMDRTEQTSSYSKMIGNHLLNLIEGYSGILILTTNFADLIDPAFGRRIDVIVEFKRPNLDLQVKILKSMLEPDAPLDKEVDLRKALEGLNMTGGLIRNAVEKLVVKMSIAALDSISQELLREALVEISTGEKAITERGHKKLGL